MRFFRSLGFGAGLRFFLLSVLFFEDGAANDGVRFSFGRGLFVLGFDEVGGQSGNLIVV
jgi:hypothetical protein